MSFLYHVFGLRLQSDIELPDLRVTTGAPEVVLRYGEKSEFPTDFAKGYHFLNERETFLNWGDDYQAFIRDGREVIILRENSLTLNHLRNLILISPMNALLYQRGYLILHGSAVVIDGGAAIFIGLSGQGKSTLAASLRLRGHTGITDDNVVINWQDETPYIYPAYRQHRLMPDAVSALGMEPETMPLVYDGDIKRNLRYDDRFAEAPVVPRRLYSLARGDAHRIEPMPPQQAFAELLRHCYAGSMQMILGINPLRQTKREASNLQQCAQLATQTPMRRLTRAWDLNSIDDSLALIEADMLETE